MECAQTRLQPQVMGRVSCYCKSMCSQLNFVHSNANFLDLSTSLPFSVVLNRGKNLLFCFHKLDSGLLIFLVASLLVTECDVVFVQEL